MWCDWSSFLTTDDAFNYFYDIIYAVVRESIPTFQSGTKKFPFWYDKELREHIKLKEKCHASYLRTGRNKQCDSYILFSKLRKIIKNMQKQCHKLHLSKVETDVQKNSKRFWSHVKSLKASGNIPKSMKYADTVYDTTDNIVKAFSLFFKSVFIAYDTSYRPQCFSVDCSIFTIPLISASDVKNILRSLEPSTSTGSDNIPAVFIIRCADDLSKPIADLFNLSLLRGEYPTILKKDNVIPIYKRKGSKSEVISYRAISLQPILAKIFEGFVNKELRHHVTNMIIDNQHGFLPSKSCATNLLSYTDFISKSFDRKNQTHSIYTDFKKAFDLVPHHLLLLKLNKQFGIEGVLYDWFKSYLNGRKQRVIINGVNSEWYDVTSGVPQGSILGPTLFLLYVNDISMSIKRSELLLFADDAKLFKEIHCYNDCLDLQNDINEFSKWCNTWCMQLSLDKCFQMNFSLKRSLNISFDYEMNGTYLESVKTMKDLGVHFTYNLNFSFHISKIVKKSYQMLGFMKRVTRGFSDKRTFNILYNSLIRSRLDYCSQVWSPSDQTAINSLESVQKRYLKYLCYKQKVMYYNYDYPTVCSLFNFSTLETRRKCSDLVFLNKMLHNKVNCPYLISQVTLSIPVRRVRCISTRRVVAQQGEPKPTFHTESRLLCRQYSFVPRVLSSANDNDLYDELVMSHPATFKSLIKHAF